MFSSYQAVLLMVSSVDWTDIMTNSLGKVKRVAFNWVMADSCRETTNSLSHPSMSWAAATQVQLSSCGGWCGVSCGSQRKGGCSYSLGII